MDFSPITCDLFIGATPLVRDLGVQLVINMRIEHRPRPDPRAEARRS